MMNMKLLSFVTPLSIYQEYYPSSLTTIILLLEWYCMDFKDELWVPKPLNTSNIHHCGLVDTIWSALCIPFKICGVGFSHASSVLNFFGFMTIVDPIDAPLSISHLSLKWQISDFPLRKNNVGPVHPEMERVWYIIIDTREYEFFFSWFFLPWLSNTLALPLPHAWNHVLLTP